MKAKIKKEGGLGVQEMVVLTQESSRLKSQEDRYAGGTDSHQPSVGRIEGLWEKRDSMQ